jgi:hypothetical protein
MTLRVGFLLTPDIEEMRNREGTRPSAEPGRYTALVIMKPELTLSCMLLVLLGACASGEWVKAGGEIADEPVLAQCTQQAWARAQREQMSNAASAPIPQDMSGRPGSSASSSMRPQSDVQQQTFFNLCMKEKGYDFVPVGPGASR